jgi:hypothetical protein
VVENVVLNRVVERVPWAKPINVKNTVVENVVLNRVVELVPLAKPINV